MRRQREQESLNSLRSAITPLVAQGDPASLARARAITNIEARAERTAEFKARLQSSVRKSLGAATPEDLAPPPAKAKKKGGGGLFGGLKSAAESAAGAVGDVAGGAFDVAKDVGSDVKHVSGKAVSGALAGMDLARENVGGPAFSVLSGSLAEKRKPILDANGNPTGQYYRDAPSFLDAGKSLLQAATHNPVDTYKAARQANDERLQDPELNAFTRTLLQGAQDPLTWVGPGAVKGALRGAPAAVQASRGARVAGSLLESPRAVSAGSVVGAAAGAQVAENMDLGPTGSTIASLVGGVAGGGLAGHVANRGVRQSLKDVDRGLAKVQGREGLPAAVGLGIDEVGDAAGSGKQARPPLRVVGKRGRGRVVGFDFEVGADAQPGQRIATPYGSAILERLEGDRAAGDQWVAKFERSSGDRQVLKSDTVLLRQPKASGERVAGFTTEKGSTYTLGEDGKTTRTKAARAEHPGDEGLKPASEKTVYIRDMPATVAELQEMIQAGNFERQPAVGLHPVELWQDSYHVGNKITKLETATSANSANAAAAAALPEGVSPPAADLLRAAAADTPAAGTRTRNEVIREMTQAAIDGDTARVDELRQELLGARFDEPSAGAVAPAAADGGVGAPPPAEPPAPGMGGMEPDEFSNRNPGQVSVDLSGTKDLPDIREPADFTAMATAAMDEEYAREAKRAEQLAAHGYTDMDLPLNLPEAQVGLNRWDRATNVLKDTLGLTKYKEHELVTPMMRARKRMKAVADSQAARFGSLWGARATEVFERDAKGRITTLPGTPTIQDLAASLPRYEALLTPPQQTFMAELRSETGKFYDLLQAAHIDIGEFRKDVVEGGGFYLPRGKAEAEALGALEPTYASGLNRGANTKRGFEKEASFPSMAGPDGGIEAGYRYSDFGDALQGYARDAGRRSIDTATSDYLKSLRWEDGQPVGLSYADRIDEGLRSAYQEKVKKLAAVRGRLQTAERRAGLAAAESDELDQALNAFAVARDSAPESTTGREALAAQRRRQQLRQPRRRVVTEKGKVTGIEPDMFTPEGSTDRVVEAFEGLMDSSDDFANAVDSAINVTARRIATLERRGLKYKQVADSLKKQLEQTKKDLDTLTPEYRQAVATARKGDRNSRPIGFATLSGRLFPPEISNVANRYLDLEKPASGRGAVTLHTVDAFNSLMRGIRATGDVSFVGIQGLLGAVRDPAGYGKAMGVAYKSWADPQVLGKYLQDFDEAAGAAGRATSRDWAKAGLHIGGSELSEFAVEAKGLPALGRKARQLQGAKQVAEGFGRSNRMWGYFTDSMRLELADTMYESATRGGKALQAGDLEQIAHASNLATGWTPNTFGGTIGQMALFAPRFFQAQLNTIADAVSKGGIRGTEARKSLTRLLGVSVGLTVLANEISPDGLKPDQYLSPFRKKADPLSGFNPNFLRFRVGGNDATLLGPWDSLLRGLVTTAGGAADQLPGVKANGDLTSLLRSKASPAVSAAWDLLSGKTFIGENASLKDPEYLLRSFAPLSVANAGKETLTGPGALSQGLSFGGVKSTPLSPGEQLDSVAGAEYGKTWNSLEPIQKAKLKEKYPEVWQRSVEVKDQKLQRYYDLSDLKKSEQESDNELMLAGQLSVDDWSSAAADRRTELNGAREALLGDFSGSGGSKVLNAYYDAIDESKVNGRPDWDAVDAYVESLSDADRAVIERNTGASRTRLERAVSAVKREYYDLPKYRGLTSDEARDVDGLLAVVSQLAKGETKLAKAAALKKAAEVTGASEETVKQARRRIYGFLGTVPDRDRWRAKHPEYVFISGGLMTPAAVQAIQARAGGLEAAA
ncbi:MAG: hypothetical protein AB7I04_18515 [Pseudomonadales bacterium]